jgi:hypothetical protein
MFDISYFKMRGVQAIYSLHDVYVVCSTPTRGCLPLVRDVLISLIFNKNNTGLISKSKCIQY